MGRCFHLVSADSELGLIQIFHTNCRTGNAVLLKSQSGLVPSFEVIFKFSLHFGSGVMLHFTSLLKSLVFRRVKRAFPFHPINPKSGRRSETRFINAFVVMQHVVFKVALFTKSKLAWTVQGKLNVCLQNLRVVR